MKRAISLLLIVAVICSLGVSAFAWEIGAEDTNYYTQGTQVEYVGTGAESYTITVPAQLSPGQSGTVTLSGTWASNKTVKVTADTSVTLTNSINASDQKTLTITFAGIEKTGDNTQAKTYTETVSVAVMPADALFGTWSGRFNYNVELLAGFHYGDLYTATAADGTPVSLVIGADGSAKICQNYGLTDTAPAGAVVINDNKMFFAGELVGHVSTDATQIVAVENESFPGFGGMIFIHEPNKQIFPIYWGATYRGIHAILDDGRELMYEETFYPDGTHYIFQETGFGTANSNSGILTYNPETLEITISIYIGGEIVSLPYGKAAPDGQSIYMGDYTIYLTN